MKIFIDSANLQDIEDALKRGFASGITTNPSLLAKEPKSAFETHIVKIIELAKKYGGNLPLSVEVFSQDKDEILAQARDFVRRFNYPELNIKIPIGWNELEIIKTLKAEGIAVNCTCNMSVTQAVMAANAGADYVSLFWGRIRDGGGKANREMTEAREKYCSDRKLDDKEAFDPFRVVGQTRSIFDRGHANSQIIVGSIRSVSDIQRAWLAGAHIVTVPPKFFKEMITHFKTDEVIKQFLTDFGTWLK